MWDGVGEEDNEITGDDDECFVCESVWNEVGSTEWSVMQWSINSYIDASTYMPHHQQATDKCQLVNGWYTYQYTGLV